MKHHQSLSWKNAFLLAVLSRYVEGDMITHKYKKGDVVDLWVNKVGPYSNPQEAYEYYTLPFCASSSEKHDLPAPNPSLSEILGGHTLRHTGFEIPFGKESHVGECTTKPLTAAESLKFENAVEHQYFYQMYLDDLPVWGMVGEMMPLNKNDAKLVPFVYQDRHMSISYNGDRIVKVDLASDSASLAQVKEGVTLTFRLSITWSKTDEHFHSRFDRYLDHAFFKHQIHWFSVFNSFMMVLFLTGLVSLIFLRTLRRDYARYSSSSSSAAMEAAEEGDEKGHLISNVNVPEDSGWKQVHGDVFRAPLNLPLFASILGTGCQLIVLALSVILFALAGPLHGDAYEERGEILHASLVSYALSSIIAGYASGSFFMKYTRSATKKSKMPSQAWQGVMVLTVLLLPTLLTVVLSVLNALSIYYQTLYIIPFFTICKLFFLWIFTSVPLSIFGTLLGRHAFRKDFPCRVNSIPRPIPEETSWYGQPIYLIPLSGILPFGSIFIELYYILTSLWNYKYYHVYGFLFGMYTILGIVVSMTSIISTYFCLNAENYHWQWNAFFSGASASIYVLLYGIYYFWFKTTMYGLLQTCFYFGYMILISISLGCLTGTIGFISSAKFVETIFRNVKVD